MNFIVECREGYYGLDCMGYCNNCLNTSCEILEGNCTFGCINKFSGPQCREAGKYRMSVLSIDFALKVDCGKIYLRIKFLMLLALFKVLI